ncbi:MAG: HNH endonuclease, partial [Chloroflexi bacterium]|nr:HNH endonuclease [Chloroflexota bacterium]
MWEEMTSNWENFAIESQAALTSFGLVEGAQDHEPGTEESFDETSRSGTDRPVLSTTRVGQDFFRSAVLSSYNYRCCITGLSVPRLLIASHIIPWRLNQENRVNPGNGLSLNALHDKAFD